MQRHHALLEGFAHTYEFKSLNTNIFIDFQISALVAWKSLQKPSLLLSFIFNINIYSHFTPEGSFGKCQETCVNLAALMFNKGSRFQQTFTSDQKCLQLVAEFSLAPNYAAYIPICHPYTLCLCPMLSIHCRYRYVCTAPAGVNGSSCSYTCTG